MTPPPIPLPYAWAFWSLAIALGALGVAVLLWSLFWDRPRGRRRCPKCSYDMSRTDGTRCPECGRDAKSERRLFRTRRRWRWAGLALLFLTGALALYITPFARSPQWWRVAPTTYLIARSLDDLGPSIAEIDSTLEIRLQDTHVWSWQQRWVARRVARYLQRKHPGDVPQRALRILQKVGPDGVAAVPAVLPFLESEDFIEKVLAWGTLAHIGVRDPDAARRLNDFLTDPASDNALRQRITNRLGDNGPESACAIPSLVQIIERPELHAANNGFIIGGAAYTLGKIGPEAADALPTLRTLAADLSQPLPHRYAAELAIALIKRDVTSDAAFHVRRLEDPEVEIRRWASNCLSDFDISRNGRAAIPALLKALQDPDEAVQANARLALAAMIYEDPRSIKELKRIAGGPDAAMAALAAETIERGGRSTAKMFAAPAPPPAPPPPAPSSTPTTSTK